MTKAPLFAARAGRDDVTDLDLAVRHDDAVDEELDELALSLEGGVGQPRPDPAAEILDARRQPGHFGVPIRLCRQLLLLLVERSEVLLQILAATLILRQRDHPADIGVRQPFQLLPKTLPGAAELRAAVLQLLWEPLAPVGALQRLGDALRMGQHVAEVVPD